MTIDKVIEKEGEMLGGKAAANALISHYKSVGNIELPEERIQKLTKQIEIMKIQSQNQSTVASIPN